VSVVVDVVEVVEAAAVVDDDDDVDVHGDERVDVW
jgi:hypothetical protein